MILISDTMPKKACTYALLDFLSDNFISETTVSHETSTQGNEEEGNGDLIVLFFPIFLKGQHVSRTH